MHIPDGYLSPPLIAVTGAAGLAGVTLASRRAAQTLEEGASR